MMKNDVKPQNQPQEQVRKERKKVGTAQFIRNVFHYMNPFALMSVVILMPTLALLAGHLLYTGVLAMINGFVASFTAVVTPVYAICIMAVAVVIFAIAAILQYGDSREEKGRHVLKRAKKK